jgi:hypothetical protein
MGVRRKVLLRYVRKFKGKQARPHVEKYTPTRYAGGRTYERLPQYGGKSIGHLRHSKKQGRSCQKESY